MEIETNKSYKNGILDPAPAQAKRGTNALILFSVVVFFTPLFFNRFLWAGIDRSPETHYAIWVVLTALMVVSWYPVTLAVKAAYRGDNAGIAQNFGFSAIISLLMVIGIIYVWVTGNLGVSTPFGENVYTDAAAFLLMFACGLIAFAAHVTSAIRGKEKRDEAWKVHNIADFWKTMVVLWGIFFIIFFLI